MKAAFFDVDGTLAETRVWSGITEYFKKIGKKRVTHLAFSVYHMSLYFLFKLGLISSKAFREPWARHISWYFKGISEAEMEKAWDWISTSYMKGRWREDVVQRLREHKENGDVIFLVSGGTEPMLARFANDLGADHAVGTRHQVKNGIFTGRAIGSACQAENKEIFTKQRIQELGLQIDFDASYAYADSPGDIQMLEMVGNPIATYPDKDLLPIVQERGWKIFPTIE